MRVRPTLVCLAAVLLPACAAGPAREGGPQRGIGNPRNAITTEQIRATDVANAHDIVQQLRPEWLRARAPVASLRDPRTPRVLVLLDGQRYGELSALGDIPAPLIASISYATGADLDRLLPPAEVGVTFAVIHVQSVGYAERMSSVSPVAKSSQGRTRVVASIYPLGSTTELKSDRAHRKAYAARGWRNVDERGAPNSLAVGVRGSILERTSFEITASRATAPLQEVYSNTRTTIRYRETHTHISILVVGEEGRLRAGVGAHVQPVELEHFRRVEDCQSVCEMTGTDALLLAGAALDLGATVVRLGAFSLDFRAQGRAVGRRKIDTSPDRPLYELGGNTVLVAVGAAWRVH